MSHFWDTHHSKLFIWKTRLICTGLQPCLWLGCRGLSGRNQSKTTETRVLCKGSYLMHSSALITMVCLIFRIKPILMLFLDTRYPNSQRRQSPLRLYQHTA